VYISSAKIVHPTGNFKIFFLKSIQFLIIKILNLFLKIFFPKINLKQNEIIISRAFFSPWKKDLNFKIFYNKIKKYTLLDEPRAYTLWYLIKNLKKEKGAVLDIGCMMGGSSYLLSRGCKKNKVYAFDTFEGFLDRDSNYNKKHFVYRDYNFLKKTAKFLNLNNLKIIKGYFPLKSFKEKKIKFAHVDVNTFSSTKKIFFYLKNKIVKNGVIIFDDYGIYGNNNVKKFVDKIYKKNLKYFNFIYNFMGQCILIKK